MDGLREWVDITQQQFDVFKVIYKLGKSGTRVTVPSIEDDYLMQFNLKLRKPNLHAVIRMLLDKGIITRSSRGEYEVNYHGIEMLLNKSESSIKEKLYGIRKFKSGYLENMKNFPVSTYIPVRVLDYPTSYEILSKILLTADRYYCINRFPGICYSEVLSHAINRGHYGEVLTERCLVRKELKVKYLSQLDIQRPFSQALNVYKNVDRAYKECLRMIDQLEDQIYNAEILELRYLEQPSEWYIQFVFPEDVFINIKTLEGETKNLLYLKSMDVGKHAYSIFQEKIKCSEKINSENIRQYAEKMKMDLKIVADYRNKKIMKEKLSYDGV